MSKKINKLWSNNGDSLYCTFITIIFIAQFIFMFPVCDRLTSLIHRNKIQLLSHDATIAIIIFLLLLLITFIGHRYIIKNDNSDGDLHDEWLRGIQILSAASLIFILSKSYIDLASLFNEKRPYLLSLYSMMAGVLSGILIPSLISAILYYKKYIPSFFKKKKYIVNTDNPQKKPPDKLLICLFIASVSFVPYIYFINSDKEMEYFVLIASAIYSALLSKYLKI